MALLNLLFNRPKKFKINEPREDGSERELLIIDAADNVSHVNDADPTDNPVEEGADVSDHVDVKPKTLSFEATMSEAPIKLEAAILGNVAGAVGAVAGKALGGIAQTVATAATTALGGLLLNEPGNRVQDAFNAMLDIQEKSIPVTLITGLKAYTNMILTSFNPIERASTGDSMVFSCTFREIRIAQSEQIVLPERVLNPAVAASAASLVNQGKKVSPNANDQVAGRGSSILASLTGLGA